MTENDSKAPESAQKPFYKRVWVWALIVVIAAGGYAYATSKGGGTTSSDGTGTKSSTEQKDETKKAAYDLTDVKLVGPDQLKTYKVSGKLKNLSNEKKSLVFVNYKIKDKDGNLLDTLTAYTSSISPGETWNFTTTMYAAGGDGPTPASFELEEVKGF